MTDIAEAYGKTLYSLANECEATEEILGQIAVLRQAFAENPKYLTLMGAPTLKKEEERVALVDEAFDGKLHVYLLNFLKVLIENNSVHEFMDAAKQFRKEYNWEHGIETVTVVVCRCARCRTGGRADRETAQSDRQGNSSGKARRSVRIGRSASANGRTPDGRHRQE